MGVLETIKSIFEERGVDSVNMSYTGRDIAKVTDHPKIGIDSRENTDRIARNFRYYSNLFPDIQYRNSYGETQKREI